MHNPIVTELPRISAPSGNSRLEHRRNTVDLKPHPCCGISLLSSCQSFFGSFRSGALPCRI
jgi:hypothetical protein